MIEQKYEVVIVTGSRKWSTMKNLRDLKAALDEINPDMVVHGGADGADSAAHRWCKKNGKISMVYYPDYEKYGKGAPLKRNIVMLEEHPEALVVGCPYPDSRGTIYTMRNAEMKDMEVQVIPHGQ